MPSRSMTGGRALATFDVTVQGFQGDYNVHRTERKNSDPYKALLLMPLETIVELNSEGWPVNPGDLGENITTSGLLYDSFSVGQRYRIDEAEIEISEPCTPCVNVSLLPYVGEEKVTKFMSILAKPTNRRGWYAKVLREGRICKGDPIIVSGETA
ncbi:MOSC domain-containing protein [Candidatus Woesearchaeota archaeon]|nr:MOSC domain-containing protein [Candidatus Woesearchaeota archaeon]